jgi:hypothetical protein
MKCECIHPIKKEECKNEVTHILTLHSNIWANLNEVNCQKLYICTEHKNIFEANKELMQPIKSIVKINQ